MSCPQCPHCKSEVQLGGLPLSDSNTNGTTTEKETPKIRVRGPAREYTQAFESAWEAYVRREQKFEAFAIWLLRSKEAGGEAKLLTLILAALKWQTPLWAVEDYKFAPYFERYLKRRKWEDEPPPRPQAVPRPIDRRAEATDKKIAEYRRAQERTADPTAVAELMKGWQRG